MWHRNLGRVIAANSSPTLASSELMLREVRVAGVPGDAFGDPTGLRVSYAIETSQVEEGLQRMSLFFDNIV
jgi:aspartate aminotransferase